MRLKKMYLYQFYNNNYCNYNEYLTNILNNSFTPENQPIDFFSRFVQVNLHILDDVSVTTLSFSPSFALSSPSFCFNKVLAAVDALCACLILASACANKVACSKIKTIKRRITKERNMAKPDM
uniref:CSON007552 protein n=1 Tax=Culicoides sonorensis TaxID=179676 RepID=A0A336N0G1_CULSO